MKRNKKVLLFVLSASVIIASVGFSSFVVNQTITNDYSATNVEAGEPIAYISETNTYFTTVERAVEVANESSSTVNIYVIAGTRYTLTRSVTINSNVILNLPYDGEDCVGYYGEIYGEDTGTEALKNPDTYLKTQLILGEGVTITNYGTINVGGIIGSEGGGYEPGGQTASYYSEILCNGVKDDDENYIPQILNYGTIENRGSIAGSSDDVFGLANYSGSTLITPMVVSENRGGTAFVNLAGGWGSVSDPNWQCAPFNRMYFPNTSVKTITYHGANINALVDLYAASQDNYDEITLFGSASSCFIQSVDENSYLITQSNLIEDAISYNYNRTKTYSSYDQLDADFYGDFNINYFEMEITVVIPYINYPVSVLVSTEDVLYPVSYTMDISFNSLEDMTSTVYAYQDIKILPGGSVNIGENVNFYVDNLAVYDEFIDKTTLYNQYPNVGLDAGYLEVNGNLEVDYIGGYINSSVNGASLNIKSGATIESKEIINSPGSSAEYETYTLTATGNIDDVDDSTFIATEFTYSGTTWNGPDEVIVTLSPTEFSFDSDGGTGSITASVYPSNATIENVSWTVSNSQYGSVEANSNDPLTATITANQNSSTSSDRTFTVTFSATINNQTVTAYATVTVAKSSGCLLAGTEILMADGTTKLVDDIRAGDIVKAFNHWTGRLENCLVVLNAHYNEEKTKSDVLTLTFDNGVDIGIVYKHGFYSVEDRKYVDIDPYNYKDYIGKKFAYLDQQTMKIEKATLVKGTVEAKAVKYYAPITKEHLNLVANSFINMPGSIICLQNIFDRDEKMKIIENKAKEDIDNYGLFTYETFEKFMSKAAFENFGVKYLKVSIGKGYMTWDDCFEIIAAYKEYLG